MRGIALSAEETMGADLHEVIDSFVEAFNVNDLDRVTAAR